ncbi:haloacid dehalogenase-like hydrolase domain-containing protein [Micractinium conductrix]|uniref:Haloacid dehalogenase-like hydrolase domain-containing protein n=1 Tax=Micractinium conductrix TaxID=554055 RepID=A0A2P6VQ50_9CHLO|nr:haloacid dehalogenase-like hydrolase domain-containing protein [Micractinium conductrix]|eukprot:PSC76200.1 haloacid dehalogenase-like hydrolase domain-containing protein [Micractinium conductrix]
MLAASAKPTHARQAALAGPVRTMALQCSQGANRAFLAQPAQTTCRTCRTATTARHLAVRAAASAAATGLQALIFDCDGVIVESEEIHRLAYNAAFAQFDVRCPNNPGSPVVWSVEYYDQLQNKVGGGKPKMRHYFGINGWPTSSVLGGAAPADEAQQTQLVDVLQEWKTEKYKEIIGSGEVTARPGILRLMDEARAAGVPVAVCSAATKAAVDFVLPNLLGAERFASLDLYMAGDDVKEKKPDPSIYKIAAQRLKVDPAACLVVEDSMVGLAAALGAGMRCLITYTSSTTAQDFAGADSVVSNLGDVAFAQLAAGELSGKDDRVKVAAAAANVSPGR